MNVLIQSTTYLLLMLLVLSGYHYQYATPKIVQVDINQIIETKIKALSKNDLSEAENKQAIQRFGKKLEEAISQIAAADNLIILPSQAVISGSHDLTQTIQRRLNQ